MIDAPRLTKRTTAAQTGGIALACLVLCAAPVIAGLQDQQCLLDAAGVSGCTAGDIGVNQINVILLKDGCTSLADTAIVNIELVVNSAQPTRYDIGLFLSEDGGDAIATGGECFKEALFPVAALDDTASVDPTSGFGPFLNRDSDSCGEAENSQSYNRTLSAADISLPAQYNTPAEVEIACSDTIDEFGNTTPNGYVDMGWVASWDQNASGVCNSVLQAIPGTPSKCQAGRTDSKNSIDIPIGVPNLGLTMTCDYTCVLPGDDLVCTMTYENTGVGPGDFIEYRIDYPDDPALGIASITSLSSLSDSATLEDDGGSLYGKYISFVPNGNGNDPDGNPCNGDPCLANIPAPVAPATSTTESITFTFTTSASATDPTNFVIDAYTWFRNGALESAQDTGLELQLCVTPATIAELSTHHHNEQILVEWQTGVESGTAGYHLERLDAVAGQYVRLNTGLMPAFEDSPAGGTYAFLDTRASHFSNPTYRLIAVDHNGATQIHGPYQPQVSGLPVLRDFDAIQTNGFARRAHGTDVALIADWNAQRAEREAETRQNAAREATVHGVKIRTVGEGLFKVNSAALAEKLGVPTQTVTNAVTAGALELSTGGSPVQYIAAADNSGLLFVANDADSRYTEHSTYVATLPQSPVFGALYRMREVQGFAPPVAADTTQTFKSWTEVEEDNFLVPYAVTDPEAEIWFSGFVSTGYYGDTTFNTTLAAPGVADAGNAEIRVQLLGLTDLYDGPDHHVQVRVNDVLVGEKVWDGYSETEFSAVFDQAILVSGANTVTINGVLDNGVEQSSFLVDEVNLGYQRYFTAHNGALRVSPDGHRSITVGGFSGANIEVIELASGQQPRRHRATLVEAAGSGYRVSFNAVNQESEYLVVQPNAAHSPVAVLADLASDLKNEANRADYLVIAPDSMTKGAERLVDFRVGRFPEAMSVRLEDVYDEFNFGAEDPIAIRRFLEYTYSNWDRTPDYVVLAGKGTLDPKDNLGYGTNVLPVLLSRTAAGVFASDNRFADVVGNDGVPEFAIGRIPVLSSSALSAYVQKLQNFEANGMHPGAKWALMLADNADTAGDFPSDSVAVGSLLPGWMTPEHVTHVAGTDASVTRQQIVDGLSQGASLFNYLGHGALMQFGAEAFWGVTDLAGLSNGDRLPVFSAFTCYAGNGTYPGFNSLAEEMTLLSGGGAVAAYAPAGTSINSEAAPLNRYFVEALFTHPTIGQAVQSAIAAYSADGGYRFLKDTYAITGDPAVGVQH